MSYIFFGTPEFAAIILEKLIKAGLIPKAVVCNPDRPVDRKKVITPPITKLLAQKYNIPILQPEVLTNYQLLITNYQADFFIVAAYAQILPKEILSIPKLGAIGVHPSLLPKYRGPTPIQTAILNGDEETGVTLYLMDEKIDHGAILANRKAPIANRNYKELEKGLAELAATLLIEILPKFIKGEIKPVPQNEAGATYTKKFTAQDGFIDAEALRQAENGKNPKSAEEILRRIHALNPEPGTWTLQNGKRIKLLEARITNNRLVLKTIQPEGKKPTPVS